MTLRQCLIACGLLLSSGAQAQEPARGRILSDLKGPGASPLDVACIALARGDLDAAVAALESWSDLPRREWLLARIDLERGAAHSALARLQRVAQEVHAGEVDHWSRPLLRQFDFDRAEAAFRADSLPRLAEILHTPTASHGEDPLWRAHSARLAWANGDQAAAAELWDRCHAAASESERRRAIFGWRARAAAAVDSSLAGEIFLEWAVGLRWSLELRQAIALLDASPEIARCLDRDGLRERAIAWYARILRREVALQLARSGLQSSDPRERARCFVLGAEQLYRLRKDADLKAWLAQAWPDSLGDEDRAVLRAYPWGVRRRAGNSLANAAGFDSVATQFQHTARGAEALWEAAWEYELSGDLPAAEERFLRYAEREPAPPLRSAATARAVYLPWLRGDAALALQRRQQLSAWLSDSHDLAAADWTAEAAARQLAGADSSRQYSGASRQVDARDPFRRTPPHPWSGEAQLDSLDVDSMLAALLQRQEAAFERVAREVFDSERDSLPDRRLQDAQELYRHGAFLEGDYLLNALTAARRSDAVLQFESARLAWQMGRAERQARIGFQLRALLGGHSAELDVALDIIAQPTPFARELLQAAAQNRLPAGLLWSIMRRESFYDPAVVSLAGAYGLLQLLPSTASSMATLLAIAQPDLASLCQPSTNLFLGARYVRQLLDECGGDLYRTLAAYNAGEANGERWASRRPAGLGPESILILISYSETRAYVYHVLRFWRLYADVYPELGREDGLPEG